MTMPTAMGNHGNKGNKREKWQSPLQREVIVDSYPGILPSQGGCAEGTLCEAWGPLTDEVSSAAS